MSEQNKPIDREKLLGLLRKEQTNCANKKFTSNSKNFYLGRETAMEDIIKFIESEAFDMEEKYRCPECNKINSAEEWNQSTRTVYGSNIKEIQHNDGEIFVCPSCNGYVDGCYIKLEVSP